MLPAARQLAAWATDNPDTAIDWNLLRDLWKPIYGHLVSPATCEFMFTAIATPSRFVGIIETATPATPAVSHARGRMGIVDEALHSGLPVVGSVHAQAVTTLVVDNENGWPYDPEVRDSLTRPLSELADQTDQARQAMAAKARQSVSSRTPGASADQFVFAVSKAIRRRNQKSNTLLTPRGNSGPESAEMKVISA